MPKEETNSSNCISCSHDHPTDIESCYDCAGHRGRAIRDFYNGEHQDQEAKVVSTEIVLDRKNNIIVPEFNGEKCQLIVIISYTNIHDDEVEHYTTWYREQ